jgi:hypothetical protein
MQIFGFLAAQEKQNPRRAHLHAIRESSFEKIIGMAHRSRVVSFFPLMNAFERGGPDMSTGSSKAAGFEEFYLRTSL